MKVWATERRSKLCKKFKLCRYSVLWPWLPKKY